ncbi:MAG TPA: P-II family nitrogen regulator [Mesotoga sp.]|nr:P-II family nitrogen regulator [Mesotoga sp.]HON27020.1 P-II family nitrogen regulator [Mesotoga infera]HPB64184.1 P-II family nitrogen regulator [Mesotoga sp.]HPI16234.1 P-II family nitrogen regulator [Mesotoga sp.]HPX21939.1 P-II family nitrogen regulator [Mesotoga sp.]
MTTLENRNVFRLIYVVVNFGRGSDVLRIAKEKGISGGTILLGRGTIRNGILNFFAFYESRKEIVMMVADGETAQTALEALNNEMRFDRPNHGIAFTTGICDVEGSRELELSLPEKERGEEKTMRHLITVIVDKGNAEKVIDAATEAGSKGGTIVNARGSGIHERSKLFAMEIEPEKEIVMIVSKRDTTQKIIANIRETLRIDEPGKGIIFTQLVDEAYGLLE